MSSDKFLTLRVPVDLYEEFAELAKKNERTLAAEIRLAMRDRLAAELDEVEA